MSGQLACWKNSQATLVALVTYLAKEVGQRLSAQYVQLAGTVSDSVWDEFAG